MMVNCNICLNKDSDSCKTCRNNPDYIKYYQMRSNFKEYDITCPKGFEDCVYDPVYIKTYHPEWYKRLYGDITPEEASKISCDVNDSCYDNEDK